MRRTLYGVAAAILLAPLSAAIVPAESASATQPADAAAAGIRSDSSDFTVHSFDAVYDLGRDAHRDSTLTTTETIVADFPQSDQNHGIERALPQYDRGTDLALHIVAVTDRAGHPLQYSMSGDDDDGNLLVLRIGDPDRYVHGRQIYVIRYTSRFVVAQYADTHDAEFYWDVNGVGWGQPFTRVTTTVHLRDGIASDLNGAMSCYAGAQGGTGGCPIERSGDTIHAHADALPSHQTMTVAIGFDQHAFAPRPLASDNPLFWLLPLILLALFVACAAWALGIRLTRWRDAPGRGTIIAEYSPAAAMYPALAAELLRRRRPWLAAQLVHFAVNGVLRIREYPDEPQRKRYELVLIDPKPDLLNDDETALLWALFSHNGGLNPGNTVRLDRSDTALGKRLAPRAKDAAAAVKKRALRERPRRGAGALWLGVGFLLLAVAAILHLIGAAANHGDTGWTWLIDGIVCLGSIVFFALTFPPSGLTPAGAEQRDQLKGLREYISLAEADRIRMLQEPSTAERIDVTDRSAIIRLYERLLPYAMVWGIEKKWIRELEVNYGTDATPDWYVGTNSLVGLSAFSAAVTTGSSASSASWSGSGGSSSFGGSGGGGFSGGGGGGGGGGGW